MSPSGHFMYIHAVKPYNQPESVNISPVHEPKENIEICLNCTMPHECRPNSEFCPLKTKGESSRDRTESRAERDQKILEMLNAGYSDKEIIENLCIKKSTYDSIKNRMRKRGQIE